MNFELTEEQQMIQEAARDFSQSEIAPIAAQFDESGEFPLENMAALVLMRSDSPWLSKRSPRPMQRTAR